jgi:hypothetical protein
MGSYTGIDSVYKLDCLSHSESSSFIFIGLVQLRILRLDGYYRHYGDLIIRFQCLPWLKG